MVEKDFQKEFKKYLDKKPPEVTEVYELKMCKKNAMPFSAVQPHQVAALLQVSREAFYHKIQDFPTSWAMSSGMRFTKSKPFDCLVVVKAAAFVVIWYYVPRGPKRFVKIPISAFLHESQTSFRKSLTKERAEEIGEVISL